jgi:hypothetical protein
MWPKATNGGRMTLSDAHTEDPLTCMEQPCRYRHGRSLTALPFLITAA